MTNIISIQSTVLNDLVGNQAARYVLGSKKYNFYEIPTIILTSHKAHKNSIQLNSKNLNPLVVYNYLKKTYPTSPITGSSNIFFCFRIIFCIAFAASKFGV